MKKPRLALALAAAALLAGAATCRAQLMYYDYNNSRITVDNSFSVTGSIVAGGNLYGANVYASDWFRNYDAQQGFAASFYGSGYFYPEDSRTWVLTGSSNYPRLNFLDTLSGTQRGVLYSDASGFGLMGSAGGKMLFVPYGNSLRVNFPSASGLDIGSYNLRQTPTASGSIAFITGAGGYPGIAMGNTTSAPIFAFSGTTGGVYYQAGGYWENQLSGNNWTFRGNFNVEWPYYLSSTSHPTYGPRRVLTKVIVQEAITGGIVGTFPTAPSCPAGTTADLGVNNIYATQFRSCQFGSGGYGGYNSVP